MSVAVGIDIGTFAVKVAVLRVAYRKTTLEALVSVEIAAAGGVPEAIRAATTEALGGKPADGIAVAIEGVRSVVHTLSLPLGAQKQLEEVLPFELEAALPVDMAESTFDYRLRQNKGGFDTTEAAAQLTVLALVARTEDIRARITQLKDALGQEPERVGAGALVLANLIASIPVLGEEGASVLIDIGQKNTEILIVENGEPVFARAMSWGTEGLSSVTAQKIARELRVTIGSHRANGGTQPTRVYLCGGGGVYATSAEAFFAADLGLPVEKLPPLVIEQTTIPPERMDQLPLFAKALGLALGLNGRAPGLDLRRGALAYERGFAWVREKIPVLAGLGAVIAVSFLFSAWAQLYASNKDVTTLEAALETVTKDVLGEETSSAARAQELLTAQSGGADDDPMPRVDAFDVMVKLSSDISSNTVHDVEDLDVQKQHATIHGIVGTIPEAQSIKTALETETCLQDVNIPHFNQQPGTDRQKYTLEMDLRCPGEGGGNKKKKSSSSSSSPASSGSAGGVMARFAFLQRFRRLNPRERRLLTILGGAVAVLVFLGLPIGLEVAVLARRTDVTELRAALDAVQGARIAIRERQSKKDIIAARYVKRAPVLAGFIEALARAKKLAVSDSVDRPEIPHGKKFSERSTQVHFRKSGMLGIAKFLESVEASGYPVIVSRLSLHKRAGEPDSYDVEVGISAYDRVEPSGASPASPASSAGGDASMKERLKTLAPKIALPFFYLFALFLFARWTFPYDKLRDRLVLAFNQQQRDTNGQQELRIDEIGPSWLTGIRATNVRVLSPPSEAGKPPGELKVDEARASVSLFGLLFGSTDVSARIDGFGGTIKLDFDESSKERKVDLDLDSLNLGQIPPLTQGIGVPLEGTLAGAIKLAMADAKASKATGTLSIDIQDVAVGDGKAKLAGLLALPRLVVGTLSVAGEAREGVLKISKLSAGGKDVELIGEGKIQLRDALADSLCDLNVRFKINDAYRTKSETTKTLFGTPGSNIPPLFEMTPKVKAVETHRRAFYSWHMHGSISHPDFDPAPFAGGPSALPGGAPPSTPRMGAP